MDFDFPQELDTVESVPDQYKGLYSEGEGGKFVLDSAIHTRLINVNGLKTSLQNERQAAKTLKAEVAQFKALGLSVDEIRELAESRKSGDGGKPGDGGDFAKLRDQLVSQHKGEVEKLSGALQQKDANLHRYVARSEAARALGEAKGKTALLMPHIEGRLRVVENDKGDFEVRVLDDSGTERIGANGAYMTVSDYVSELKNHEVFGVAFEGSGRSGGGTPADAAKGNAGGRKTYSRADWLETVSKASPDDRKQLVRDLGAGKIVVQ